MSDQDEEQLILAQQARENYEMNLIVLQRHQ
jgi:hypothetical protein